jgi:hypothetical protein
VETCPGLGIPATPADLALAVRRDTAFRQANGVGIATRNDFGTESSRPASLLCTLRHPPVTRRMATLASGLPATALAGLDLHQLDFNKEFHSLM